MISRLAFPSLTTVGNTIPQTWLTSTTDAATVPLATNSLLIVFLVSEFVTPVSVFAKPPTNVLRFPLVALPPTIAVLA